MFLGNFFSGKIRLRLLTKLLLNPANKVYLRGLAKELGVSTNTVRLELEKLYEINLIQSNFNGSSSKVKEYKINSEHPLFKPLREIIIRHVGLDLVINNIVAKLGKIESVYLTGALAKGADSCFIDLVFVGEIDKSYLNYLIDKAEGLTGKKIRVALFTSKEFKEEYLRDMGVIVNLLEGSNDILK